MKPNIPTVLQPVVDHIDDAFLIAWDGCHKIYLALDETEADWFVDNYPHVVCSDPNTMLSTLVEWWEDSCSLRFVSGVHHNAENPNAGFTRIVAQFADADMEAGE